jgi:glycosyltransferase involved in cell wall biosynthesis
VTAPLVSIVVPTYGRPRFLAEALESVLAQTVDDWECLVVDDASPQPLGAPDDERFRVVRRRSNGGPAAARNSGMDAARGRYLAFLDDDDVLDPRRLEMGLSMVDRAELALCFGDDLPGWAGPPHRHLRYEGDMRDTIIDDVIPHLGQVMLPRGSAERFDESLRTSEDVEWWLRMAQRARFATLPEVGYLTRKHLGDRPGVRDGTHLEMRRRVLAKHADWFAAHPRAHAAQLGRVAAEEYLNGELARARSTALRALRRRPSRHAAKIAARATADQARNAAQRLARPPSRR